MENLDEQLLHKIESIKPIIHLHPVPWDTLCHHAQKAGCSPRTLQRWVKLYREHGIEGLRTSLQDSRKGTHKRWKEFVNKQYLDYRRPSVASVYSACVQKASQEKIDPPSYWTVRRIIQDIPPSVQSYYRNRKEFKDKYQVTGDPYQATYSGELFLIDHRQLDILILVRTSKGDKAVRPWITTVFDQYSRALVGYYLGVDPPSSRRVALALRHAILPKNDPDWPMCGIPTRLRHDHGSDLMSKHIQQVKIELHISNFPKEIENPKGDAEIERFFGTMAEWDKTLPGWTGNSIKERPEHIKPKLFLNELDREFRSFVHEYHLRKHSTTKMPPLDRWNTGLIPRLPESEAALDLLLLPVARPYKIRRDGIHFQTNRYWSDELILYIDQSVSLRYDPLRLDEIVVYVDSKWIGTAVMVEGTRLTYEAYQKRRKKQVEQMRNYKVESSSEKNKSSDSEKKTYRKQRGIHCHTLQKHPGR